MTNVELINKYRNFDTSDIAQRIKCESFRKMLRNEVKLIVYLTGKRFF